MIHPALLESIARDRQRRLVEAAARSHRLHHARAARHRPLRARAGWWLVERGMRLLASDGSGPHPAPLALRGLGR